MNTTDKDQCMTEFEEWAYGMCLPTHRTKIDPEYIDSMTHYAWQAWSHQSAALAARDAEIARLTKELADERTASARLQIHAKTLGNQAGLLHAELDKEQRNKSAWGKQQIEAERDTNAMLTNQLEKAEAEIARLRDAAEKMIQICTLPGLGAKEREIGVQWLRAALSQPASAPAAQGEPVPEAVKRLIKAMRSQQTLGYFTNDYWQDLLDDAELAAAPKEPKC